MGPVSPSSPLRYFYSGPLYSIQYTAIQYTAIRWSGPPYPDPDPGHMSRKVKSLERINSIYETNRSFDSCHSCKQLGTNRLLAFLSRIKFIRSKLSFYSFVHQFIKFIPPKFFCSCIRVHWYHQRTQTDPDGPDRPGASGEGGAATPQHGAGPAPHRSH